MGVVGPQPALQVREIIAGSQRGGSHDDRMAACDEILVNQIANVKRRRVQRRYVLSGGNLYPLDTIATWVGDDGCYLRADFIPEINSSVQIAGQSQDRFRFDFIFGITEIGTQFLQLLMQIGQVGRHVVPLDFNPRPSGLASHRVGYAQLQAVYASRFRVLVAEKGQHGQEFLELGSNLRNDLVDIRGEQFHVAPHGCRQMGGDFGYDLLDQAILLTSATRGAAEQTDLLLDNVLKDLVTQLPGGCILQVMRFVDHQVTIIRQNGIFCSGVCQQQ